MRKADGGGPLTEMNIVGYLYEPGMPLAIAILWSSVASLPQIIRPGHDELPARWQDVQPAYREWLCARRKDE